MNRLEQIKERFKDTTARDWEVSKNGYAVIADAYGGIGQVLVARAAQVPAGGERRGNNIFIAHAHQDVPYLLEQIEKRDRLIKAMLLIVNDQAEDEALWFRAEKIAEAYFQQELRRLHCAVEAARLEISNES